MRSSGTLTPLIEFRKYGLDRMIAKGAIEWLSGHGGHHFDPREACIASGCLTQPKHHAPNPAAGEIGIGIHRTDLGRIDHGIESHGGTGDDAVVPAVKGGAPAPAAAPDDPPVQLDDEIGTIEDQLRIKPHYLVARTHLLGAEEITLQPIDRPRHQYAECRQVVGASKAMCEAVHALESWGQFGPVANKIGAGKMTSPPRSFARLTD